MKLYNTLSAKIEEFKTIEGKKIRMYTCGPTVYDTAHIGNLRKYLCDDILVRLLKFEGSEIKRVMNITDIDDKTIKRAEGVKKDFDILIRKYENQFLADLDSLNVLRPDKVTRATEYVEDMAAFVEDLLKKGFAYKTSDGSVYFSLEKFPSYGELSKLDKREIKVGARINSDEYEKENPSDFVIWKAWDEADGEIFWNTSLGKGRPGWHLECSTMSMKELGETIDIHTGGIDNIFPHHENEIAQSEARSGKKFVNFWVHSEMLMVDSRKMSKSLNNFYKLADIIEKGYSPMDFRYLVLTAQYRSKLNFTWDGLESAKNSRARLVRLVQEFAKADKGEANEGYIAKFKTYLENDIDLPNAIAVLWEVARDESIFAGSRYATMLRFDEVLGLKLGEKDALEIPANILEIANERKAARENKDYAKSDELRDKIAALGYIIEDKNNEFTISPK
ncbi:MAG: cysteine--tRNA ligase [Candidatus Berkelbacteria bacterium]